MLWSKENPFSNDPRGILDCGTGDELPTDLSGGLIDVVNVEVLGSDDEGILRHREGRCEG